jgi:transposase-like protein
LLRQRPPWWDDCALCLARGHRVDPGSKQTILDSGEQLGEADTHWPSFLSRLLDAPQLVGWLKGSFSETLNSLRIRAAHRRRLRTTNGLTRRNNEIKRRTTVKEL